VLDPADLISCALADEGIVAVAAVDDGDGEGGIEGD
jgi:hypothetical protein